MWVEPEQVMQDLYLPVAMHACANADGGDGQRFGDLLRERRRNALQNDGKRACALEGEGLTLKFLRFR